MFVFKENAELRILENIEEYKTKAGTIIEAGKRSNAIIVEMNHNGEKVQAILFTNTRVYKEDGVTVAGYMVWVPPVPAETQATE